MRYCTRCRNNYEAADARDHRACKRAKGGENVKPTRSGSSTGAGAEVAVHAPVVDKLVVNAVVNDKAVVNRTKDRHKDPEKRRVYLRAKMRDFRAKVKATKKERHAL